MDMYADYLRCGEIFKSPSHSNETPYILKCFQCSDIFLLLESFIFHIEDYCKPDLNLETEPLEKRQKLDSDVFKENIGQDTIDTNEMLKTLPGIKSNLQYQQVSGRDSQDEETMSVPNTDIDESESEAIDGTSANADMVQLKEINFDATSQRNHDSTIVVKNEPLFDDEPEFVPEDDSIVLRNYDQSFMAVETKSICIYDGHNSNDDSGSISSASAKLAMNAGHVNDDLMRLNSCQKVENWIENSGRDVEKWLEKTSMDKSNSTQVDSILINNIEVFDYSDSDGEDKNSLETNEQPTEHVYMNVLNNSTEAVKDSVVKCETTAIESMLNKSNNLTNTLTELETIKKDLNIENIDEVNNENSSLHDKDNLLNNIAGQTNSKHADDSPITNDKMENSCNSSSNLSTTITHKKIKSKDHILNNIPVSSSCNQLAMQTNDTNSDNYHITNILNDEINIENSSNNSLPLKQMNTESPIEEYDMANDVSNMHSKQDIQHIKPKRDIISKVVAALEANCTYIEDDNEYDCAVSAEDCNPKKNLETFTDITSSFISDFMASTPKVFALIRAYKKQPRKWLRKTQGDLKLLLTQNSLVNITAELNTELNMHLTMQQVSALISQLHRQYREDLKRLRDNVGENKYTPPSWHFQYLDFLQPFKEGNSSLNVFDKRQANLKREEILLILEIYKYCRTLWNSNLAEYCCDNKRQEAIVNMKAKLESHMNFKVSLASLNSYISCLHNFFSKEKRRYIYTGIASEYFNKMLFLYDHVGPFKCSLCVEEFNTPLLFKMHKLSDHSKTHIAFPFTCSVCNQQFRNVHQYVAHAKRHFMKCETCTESFVSMENLIEHRKTHLRVKTIVGTVEQHEGVQGNQIKYTVSGRKFRKFGNYSLFIRKDQNK